MIVFLFFSLSPSEPLSLLHSLVRRRLRRQRRRRSTGDGEEQEIRRGAGVRRNRPLIPETDFRVIVDGRPTVIRVVAPVTRFLLFL